MTTPADREPDPEQRPFTTLDGPAEGATVFACPLCGHRFTHGEQACGACPLTAGCDVVQCPNCRYQFPRTSLLVEWVRRLLRRRREP